MAPFYFNQRYDSTAKSDILRVRMHKYAISHLRTGPHQLLVERKKGTGILIRVSFGIHKFLQSHELIALLLIAFNYVGQGLNGLASVESAVMG